jgi:acyl-coenzyme A synthetase/AMP-(fatty) acid ligase
MIRLYQNPIWSRISVWATQKPNAVCLQDTYNRKLTYSELAQQVNTTALELQKMGFKEGDRAFFLARPSIQGIVYFLAVMRAGGVIAVADPAMGRASFRSRFELVEPKWLVLEPLLFWIQKIPFLENALRQFGIEIPDIGKSVAVRKIKVREVASDRVQAWDEAQILNTSAALIVFTSGTTEMPKGVVHTYTSIAATLDLITSDLKPQESDIFYASQLYFLFIALLTGATAILPSERRFDAVRFAEHLKHFSVTKVYALPAECEELIKYYVQRGAALPKTLTCLMLGSAPILTGFLKRLEKITPRHTDVLCIYGSTEILPISSVEMREKIAFTGKGDLLGKPFSGVHAHVDEGEIVVRGPNLCRGYFASDAMIEHHTGDLGTMDEKGRIVLLGRKKDMIIKGNYNIYPSMFESVINDIEGVKHCALIGVYREDRSDEEIVLVVEKAGDEPDEAMRTRLKNELSSGAHSIDSYAQPDKILFMQLPLSGRSKKVDKRLLREKISVL